MTKNTTYPINDWDSAYENGRFIEDPASYVERWQNKSANLRQQLTSDNRAQLDIAYGKEPRHKFDLFLPLASQPKGLVVFVHGGYWIDFDKSSWSHLAQGSLDAGYAVAMPSYTLCPQASIEQIIEEVGQAISSAAALINGDIRLAGHSAGGHLVTSMLCQYSPLPAAVRSRIKSTVSISGVHDLRPLLNTQMNSKLQLTIDNANAYSPLLSQPIVLAPLTCWVGADERPEFLRQNRLQADCWKSFALATNATEEPNKHHFNIIDGLEDQHHPLMQALLQ